MVYRVRGARTVSIRGLMAYASCPGARQGGLDFGAEEVWEPEAYGQYGYGLLLSVWLHEGKASDVYHGWSSISKTCMRGTHGAMTAVAFGAQLEALSMISRTNRAGADII